MVIVRVKKKASPPRRPYPETRNFGEKKSTRGAPAHPCSGKDNGEGMGVGVWGGPGSSLFPRLNFCYYICIVAKWVIDSPLVCALRDIFW